MERHNDTSNRARYFYNRIANGVPDLGKLLAAFIAFSTVLLCSTPAQAQRAIPDDNLAYPVLITLGNGSFGSGFFLTTKDAVYLVTAKHVLFLENSTQLINPNAELLSHSKDPKDPTKTILSVDLTIAQMSGNLKPHPTEDVVVVKLFLNGMNPANPSIFPLSGVTIRSVAKGGLLSASADTVGRFDDVLAGNEVILFGYPNSIGLQQIRQLDPTRPLLRKGIVAGTNPERHSIILDCPAYFGNSGGPVVELDPAGLGGFKLKIIGVVNQYVPFVQVAGSPTVAMQVVSNSGYSVITPMDYVLELIN